MEALRTSADVVLGAPDRVDVLDADADRGAFLGPVLLRAQPGAAEPHDVEAFGPVSTVLTYDTLDDAVALAARGKGSLVGVGGHPRPRRRPHVTLGLAPWHGRILVLDRDDARSPPATAAAAVPRARRARSRRRRRGAGRHPRRRPPHAAHRPAGLPRHAHRHHRPLDRRLAAPDDGVHPFRKSLAELRIGDTIASAPRTVTLADIDHFAEFTGDTFYAHTDPEAAAANPLFGGIVAHGYLVVSLAAGLFVDPDPGPVLANFGVDHLRFLTPVKADDTIAVTLTVKQITPRTDADYGEVRWDAVVTNADGAPVATYDVLTLVAKTWPPETTA